MPANSHDATSGMHSQSPIDRQIAARRTIAARGSSYSVFRYSVPFPKLKQTFMVPAWCIEHYPKAVEAMLSGGHEIGFHSYIHEGPNNLSRDAEH